MKNSDIAVLKMVYQQEPITASQISLSNANQYLISLENAKLIVRRWHCEGRRRFKLASINPKKHSEVCKLIGVQKDGAK